MQSEGGVSMVILLSAAEVLCLLILRSVSEHPEHLVKLQSLVAESNQWMIFSLS